MGPSIELKLPRETAGFRILRRLGEGGMGTVYEAEDLATRRHVALKVLPDGQLSSPESRERFEREARLAASISHPSCVFVYGVHQIDGAPAISMELLPGGTLAEWMLAHDVPAVHVAVGWILQVIDGLEAAYKSGVLHRDVKPGNCFLCADQRVKVGDFGLARAANNEDSITQTGTFIGTPLYASPEQIRGKRADVRSDIYGVGATLYALLTGLPAFHGGDTAGTLVRILTEEPTRPREMRAEIPAELSDVVLRAMSKDPADRFASYSDFRRALRPFADAAVAASALASTSTVMPSHRLRDARGKLGRFQVMSVVSTTSRGKLLRARDPQLERDVWIHLLSPFAERVVPVGPPPASGPAASCRLRWIASEKEGRSPFDVYERIEGASLRAALQRGTFSTWANARALLLELCEYLADAPAPLHYEQLWIDQNGRLRVLDFALSVSPDPELSPGALLGRVAREIAGSARTPGGPEGAPERARELLSELADPSQASATSPSRVVQQLSARDAQPTAVTPARRFAQGLVAFACPAAVLAARELRPDLFDANAARIAIAALAFVSIAIAAGTGRSPSLRLFRLDLRRADGRAPDRTVSALRTTAAWVPVVLVALLADSLAAPNTAARVLLGASAALVVVHALALLRDPTRGLFERLTGTRVALS